MPNPLETAVHRLRVQLAYVCASPDRSANKPGALQHFDMLRCRLERHGEWCRQFADVAVLEFQAVQHRSPRRIGEGMEDGIQLCGFIINHMVDYMTGLSDCQPVS